MAARMVAALRRAYAQYALLHELRMRRYGIGDPLAPSPLRWSGGRLVGDVLPARPRH